MKGLDTISREMRALRKENRALRKKLQEHEEQLNNLHIPETTINAIAARVLDIHAQVLLAVTRPQPAQQEQTEKG